MEITVYAHISYPSILGNVLKIGDFEWGKTKFGMIGNEKWPF